MSNDTTTNSHLVDLATEIVAAYVSHNVVPARDLPGLVPTIYATLAGLGQVQDAAAAEDAVEKPTAAQIKKSITPDAIISFIDGKPRKTLTRHLTNNGLDPQAYRQRYGLPDDYPMVAPNYSARRSELARTFGLGQLAGSRAQAAK